MYQERLILNSNDIYEKEFKVDTRGYHPQEVDKYLDIIIKDYDEMSKIIVEFEKEKKQLLEDNISLKKEIRNLKTKLDVLTENEGNCNVSNSDILRRISKLEKIIYGKE